LISVYAPVTTDASQPAKFAVNRSGNTMGWPLSDVPTANSLSCEDVERSLWFHRGTSGGKKYTITGFKVLCPSAAGNLDFVGPGEIKPSGKPDYVGQLTIKVEDRLPSPPDWLLWISTVAEMQIGTNNQDGGWKQKYDYQNAKPPFSFVYDDKASDELLKTWKLEAQHDKIDEYRTRHRLAWRDTDTGLEVRWEGLEFTDFESIEWTIYLTNTGEQETPIIEDIKALDAHFLRPKGHEYRLRHWDGTHVTADDFAPKSTLLEAGRELSFRPNGGRPTGGNWPYYNLETEGEGVIIVVGWPGRWYANYRRDSGNGLHVTSGQEATHFKLLPGETVRTPLVVMQFWREGDWIDAQNTWRQWMIKHNIPRPGGERLPLPQFAACSSHQFAEMTKANEQNQIQFIDSYLKKGLKLDYWWMDAGWYVGAVEKGWPWTGTWEVDRRPNRFPNGLRAISDHAHAKDVKIIVWFEPERVAAGTWLATEHPEWVLGGSGGGLLNLGDPKAWEWLVNHIDKIISDEGIDLYRQDYNINPLSFWRNNDAADRQGITENKYVMGYLAYWDELLRRHPELVIDSCASGGHRNDLETMRRAVPLLRSDYLFEPVGQQGHTYGLSFWLPFHGTGYTPSNAAGWGWGTGGLSYGPYVRRSNMCPHGTGCFDFRVKVDDELILKLYNEWKQIGPDYFGNYYPLTDYNLSKKEWIGWQFSSLDGAQGFVQAFRREHCMYTAAELKLRGLDPDASYVFTNHDTGKSQTLVGRELLDKGLAVSITEQPGSAVITYQKAE
jgi:alpha-galactosidase